MGDSADVPGRSECTRKENIMYTALIPCDHCKINLTEKLHNWAGYLWIVPGIGRQVSREIFSNECRAVIMRNEDFVINVTLKAIFNITEYTVQFINWNYYLLKNYKRYKILQSIFAMRDFSKLIYEHFVSFDRVPSHEIRFWNELKNSRN